MKPIPTIDIDTALSQMSRETAIDLMWRRMFCNADETVNVIAEHAIRKQIPVKPTGRYTNYKCSVCGRRVRSGKGSSSFVRDNFCQRCGQKLDWSDTE